MSNDHAGEGDLALVEALIARLHDEAAPLDRLTEANRAAVHLLLPHFQIARRHLAEAMEIPELEDDPVALALGLVPGPQDILSPTRLKRARLAAGLKVGDLSGLLRERGWAEVTVKTVFDWEQMPASMPPALINAVARVVRIEPEMIREPRVTVSADSDVVFDDPDIVIQLDGWAAATGRTRAEVQRQLTTTIAAAAARNRSTLDQALVLKIIEVMRLVDDAAGNAP